MYVYLDDDAHNTLKRDEEDTQTALLGWSSDTVSKQNISSELERLLLGSYLFNFLPKISGLVQKGGVLQSRIEVRPYFGPFLESRIENLFWGFLESRIEVGGY